MKKVDKQLDIFLHLQLSQITIPIMLNKEEANLLKQPQNTLALKIDRVVYKSNEEVMECTVSVFMSHKYYFEIVLHED